MSNNTPKMNNNTHKVFCVTRKVCFQKEFAVPNGWELRDIVVKDDKLYYKGILQDVPENEPVCEEEDTDMCLWGGGESGGVEDCFDCDTTPN
jgi:hypothetical protein